MSGPDLEPSDESSVVPAPGSSAVCASCGAALVPGDAFCEACGADVAAAPAVDRSALDPSGVAPLDLSAPEGGDGPAFAAATVIAAPPRRITVPPPGPCVACGGAVADDGFCGTCGAKARTWRDHWTETPASWVGAVCDRGVRHARNEDALATSAGPVAAPADGSLAVVVVCDGVTTAPDSDQASLAAATAACDHLEATVGAGPHPPGAAGIEVATRWMNAACRIAQVAVLGVTDRLVAAATAAGAPAIDESPSCTFVAAVVTGRRIVVGWCGDSRAYWLADDGTRLQLGTDHSMAAELMAQGMSRADAERDPQAHTITRWLGADSVRPTPDVVTLDADGPGWLLVCSDGLWNYASEPDELAALVAGAVAAGADTPVAVAESLAAHANDCGGHDNVTVALVRMAAPGGPDLTTSTAPEPAAAVAPDPETTTQEV